MNSSVLSTYDNLDQDCNGNFENEAVLLVISDILKVIQNGCPVSYCPFCTSSFCQKNLLQAHLLAVHYAFLWELTNRTVQLDSCPLCSGKFAGYHLVAKHSLSYHGQVLVDTYFPKRHSFLQCIFCQLSIGGKLMASHVEEFHTLQFVDWFKAKFKLKSESVSGLVNIDCEESKKQPPTVCDIDEINMKLKELNVLSIDKSPKSILKKQGLSKEEKKPVRRVLSFADENKENFAFSNFELPNVEPERADTDRRTSLDNTWGAVLRDSRFRCGKCSIFFSNHSLLTAHVKKDHKPLSFKPVYQCGVCSAKFFKSSYLKKHSSLHSLKKMR